MNWEVSSMQLKTSFFNPTLFKKNLTRSWPLWGGVTAVGSLVPLYLILGLMSHENVYFEREDFVSFLYQAAVYFLPVFTFCYAILVAMFVWSYLHNSRSVGMMHSLAIDRTGLFVTNTLSGLAMLLIPYVVVGGLMSIIAAGWGAMDVGAVMLTIAAVILENLLFFGMGTLCAAVTGSVIATAAYYLVLNFAVPALDALINLLAQEFIFGLTSSSSELSLWFSPVISLYDRVELVYRSEEGVRMDIPEIKGFGIIVLYGIVGIAMLALSWLLYRIRRSESAGDVVAYKWLRPVFRFGIAIVSALTLGRVLYELFWASLFSAGRYADMVPMAVCMAISAVVGYYAASMLLEKTLRVFKGSLKGIGIVCAATVVLCLAVTLDIFGIEKYVPDSEDIESVWLHGYVDIECDADEFPGLLEDIRELHGAIIADKHYVRGNNSESWVNTDGEYTRWASFSFTYWLKNGSTVSRYYYLPLTGSRMEDPDTYDSKFYAIVSSPEVLIASVTVPEDAEIVSLYLEGYNAEMDCYESVDLDRTAWETVYSALRRDAGEGNFVAQDAFYFGNLKEMAEKEEGFFHEAYLYVDYRLFDAEWDGYDYGHITVQLQPTMQHTLKALVAVGALDQKTIDCWSSDAYTIAIG